MRAYYAELTHAAQTNDTSVLASMTTKACPCYRPVTVIEKNARRGYTTPEASFEVVTVRAHDVEGATGSAEVRTSESAYDVLGRDGKVVGHVDARKNNLDLALVRQPSGVWIIGNEFDLKGTG